MHKICALLGTLCWLALVASAKDNFLPDRDVPVPPDQPIPGLDFARPLLFDQPVLNPAGTHFAALTYNQELRRSVLVCEIATGRYEWAAGDAYRFDWISDRHLLLNHIDDDTPLRGGRLRRDGKVWAFEISDLRKPVDGLKVLPALKRGFQPQTGFQWGWPPDLPNNLDIATQRFWTRPEDGKPGYCQVIGKDGQRRLLRWVDSGWVPCPVDLNEITPVAVVDRPEEMIVVGPPAPGQPRALQSINTSTGTLGAIIYRDDTYDCSPVIHYRRGTRVIAGVSVASMDQRIVWLDPAMQQIQALLNKQFPRMLVQIVSTDLKQSRFLVKVQSDRQPPTFYLYDQERKSLGLIKNTGPWIEPSRMRPTHIISYKTRDGLALEGLLTLPANASKENPVPVIVLIHGGPWSARFSWGWSNQTQFLASRGYAVLEPNYRGSLGDDSRGDPRDRFDFEKMHRDVSDGVGSVLKTGLVLHQQVGVVGYGHGSYLALCSVLEQPSLYRCAILYGGIFDWEKAFKKMDSRTMAEDEWLRLRLKAYNHNPVSPLRRADEIKIPVFFNRNLSVLDITLENQSHEMFRALRKNPGVISFGDLNIYTPNEVYAEMAERTEQTEKFLLQHLSGK